MRFQSAWTRCNGTLSRCASRSSRRQSQLSDVAAKLVIYRAFIELWLEVPKHLARPVHDLYFSPQYEEFQARTC